MVRTVYLGMCQNYLTLIDHDDMGHSGYAKLLGGVPNEDTNDLLNNEAEDIGPITTKHLLSWAYQIAKGMEYLGSMKVIQLTFSRYGIFCSLQAGQ